MSGQVGSIERDSTSTIFYMTNGFAFAELEPYRKTAWIAGTFSSESNGRGLAYSEYQYVGGKGSPKQFATREEAEAEAVKLARQQDDDGLPTDAEIAEMEAGNEPEFFSPEDEDEGGLIEDTSVRLNAYALELLGAPAGLTVMPLGELIATLIEAHSADGETRAALVGLEVYYGEQVVARLI